MLKVEIDTKNTINTIGIFVKPVLRYKFGVLKWTTTELQGMDRKVRKVSTKGKCHHSKSNTNIL